MCVCVCVCVCCVMEELMCVVLWTSWCVLCHGRVGECCIGSASDLINEALLCIYQLRERPHVLSWLWYWIFL